MSDAKKRYEELRARDQALYEKVNDLLSRAREIISQTDSLEESELDRKISEIYFEIIGLNSDYKKLVELRITMIPRLKELDQTELDEYKNDQSIFDNVGRQIEELRIFFHERMEVKFFH